MIIRNYVPLRIACVKVCCIRFMLYELTNYKVKMMKYLNEELDMLEAMLKFLGM